MARKVKNTNNPELDGPAFFAAIAQIEQEKGIKSGYMMEKITQALISAYRRDHEGVGDNLTVEADPHACTVRMFLKKDIVEQVDNPGMEISLAEARRAIPHAQLGDVVRLICSSLGRKLRLGLRRFLPHSCEERNRIDNLIRRDFFHRLGNSILHKLIRSYRPRLRRTAIVLIIPHNYNIIGKHSLFFSVILLIICLRNIIIHR